MDEHTADARDEQSNPYAELREEMNQQYTQLKESMEAMVKEKDAELEKLREENKNLHRALVRQAFEPAQGVPDDSKSEEDVKKEKHGKEVELRLKRTKEMMKWV